VNTTTLFGPVAEDLARVEALLREAIAGDGEGMSGPMAELFGAGGKRIRPALVLLCGRLGSYEFESLAAAAMAVEMTHAATLVHDDVIDHAQVRRGRPTVAAAMGDSPAIVVGDYYFAKAYSQASLTRRPPVVFELASAVMRICLGELRQQRERLQYRLDRDRYLERIEAKTATLLAASCWIGGLLAGLADAQLAALRRYGISLGLAFQIADDVLDYMAEEAELGKPTGQDLLEGHATLPLMLALADGASGPPISVLLADGNALTREQVRQVVELVRASPGPPAALAEAARYAEAARAELAGLPPGPALDCLAGLTEYVVQRRW
jgi:heptaprenyl diphosphate synthase